MQEVWLASYPPGVPAGINPDEYRSLADMLAFPKSMIANFVLRHVRKQVPEYSLPSAIRFTDAMSKGRYENLAPGELTHEDIAFLQYTGGTTGVSKGAVLTHQNLVANVMQLEAWLAPDLAGTGDSTIVGALPRYHIFALNQALLFMKTGGRNLLIANPRDFGDSSGNSGSTGSRFSAA